MARRIREASIYEVMYAGQRLCDCCGQAPATTVDDGDQLCGACAAVVKAADETR